MTHITDDQRPIVAITGAAGSLGKAFVRYLQDKYLVIGIDNNEWALAEARSQFPQVQWVLADFDQWETRTDYLIHCAAYKHVDIGESSVPTFIDTNVTKTQALFARLCTNGTRFLFISTDKAVEPISTYGFTKALGERLTRHYGGSVARLGNILNSKGSVIPLWEAAIANREPIKITDERMTRYVIEDSDAVHQIWSGFMRGDRLIVPAMGQPLRLLDILKDVLSRHGYDKPEDYSPGVEVIGMRDGEKLHEKLKWDWEA